MNSRSQRQGSRAADADYAKAPRLEPMQLATLAAILAPNSPALAMENAMRLYVEAVLFLRELPSDFDEWVRRFGSSKRRLEVMARPIEECRERLNADSLELDPKKDDDDVRRFLCGQGLKLKGSRAVLDHINRYLNNLPSDTFLADGRPSAEKIIAQYKREENGETVYAIPKDVLKSIAVAARYRRSQSKSKGHETRKALKAPPALNQAPPGTVK
jgi:hypothetical protein